MVLKFFKDFSIQIRPVSDTKFRPRKNIPYNILTVTSFSVLIKLHHNSQITIKL